MVGGWWWVRKKRSQSGPAGTVEKILVPTRTEHEKPQLCVFFKITTVGENTSMSSTTNRFFVLKDSEAPVSQRRRAVYASSTSRKKIKLN
jgi:hypothetical protein